MNRLATINSVDVTLITPCCDCLRQVTYFQRHLAER
jgi:hypothetical protein